MIDLAQSAIIFQLTSRSTQPQPKLRLAKVGDVGATCVHSTASTDGHASAWEGWCASILATNTDVPSSTILGLLPGLAAYLSPELPMTRSISYRAVLAISLLVAGVSCDKKPAYVWHCLGPTATEATPRSSCSCLLFDAREEPEQRLCSQNYQCCVVHTDIAESQIRTTCDCWNPSEGGPTCESKLPAPGQESFGWKRVDRCAKW